MDVSNSLQPSSSYDHEKDLIMISASSTSTTESDSSAARSCVDGGYRYQSTTGPGSLTAPDPLNTVRTLSRRDIKRAAFALAEAFEEDAIAQYFTHTNDRQHCTRGDHWKLHVTIMEHIVKAHVYSGLATAIGKDYACVALWSVSFRTPCPP